ncbi:hypothetical protein [Brevundimonas naejangsanensis]
MRPLQHGPSAEAPPVFAWRQTDETREHLAEGVGVSVADIQAIYSTASSLNCKCSQALAKAFVGPFARLIEPRTPATAVLSV